MSQRQRRRTKAQKARAIMARGNGRYSTYGNTVAEALADSEKMWALWLTCKGLPPAREFEYNGGAIAYGLRVDAKLVIVGRNYQVPVPMPTRWEYYSNSFERKQHSYGGPWDKAPMIEAFVVEPYVWKQGRWQRVKLDDVMKRIETAITFHALGGGA